MNYASWLLLGTSKILLKILIANCFIKCPQISSNLTIYFYLAPSLCFGIGDLESQFFRSSFVNVVNILPNVMLNVPPDMTKFREMLPTLRLHLLPTDRQFNNCFNIYPYWNALTCNDPKIPLIEVPGTIAQSVLSAQSAPGMGQNNTNDCFRFFF